MFIQTESTPNPATLKFLPGQSVMESGTADFPAPVGEDTSPLAARIFGVAGVNGVFLGNDFVTVTKSADVEWDHVKPAILGAIMEHFMSGGPLMTDGSDAGEDSDGAGEFFSEDDAETVEIIKDLIETRVRPAVANDGGDITFRGFRDGIVYLNMRGACSGCPSSTATLKHGIQNLLKHFVPEVVDVEAMAAD